MQQCMLLMPIVLKKLYRESRRPVGLFLSPFLDEKSSDENGGIRRRVNTFSSAPFQEEMLGLYPGEEQGVHVKSQKGDARPIL